MTIIVEVVVVIVRSNIIFVAVARSNYSLGKLLRFLEFLARSIIINKQILKYKLLELRLKHYYTTVGSTFSLYQ